MGFKRVFPPPCLTRLGTLKNLYDMKTLLAIFIFIQFGNIYSQIDNEELSFHFRESWTNEYDIKVNILKIIDEENYELKKTVNNKTESKFIIKKNLFDSLVTEIKKIKNEVKNPGNQCSDGNYFSIQLIKNGTELNYSFFCVYDETNSEAINLLKLFKDIISNKE